MKHHQSATSSPNHTSLFFILQRENLSLEFRPFDNLESGPSTGILNTVVGHKSRITLHVDFDVVIASIRVTEYGIPGFNSPEDCSLMFIRRQKGSARIAVGRFLHHRFRNITGISDVRSPQVSIAKSHIRSDTEFVAEFV